MYIDPRIPGEIQMLFALAIAFTPDAHILSLEIVNQKYSLSTGFFSAVDGRWYVTTIPVSLLEQPALDAVSGLLQITTDVYHSFQKGDKPIPLSWVIR